MLRCRFQAVARPAPSGLPRTFPVLALKVPHSGNALSSGVVGHPTAGDSANDNDLRKVSGVSSWIMVTVGRADRTDTQVAQC